MRERQVSLSTRDAPLFKAVWRGWGLNVYQIKKLGGEMEKMKQVKYFMSDKKANKWLKENQDKKIIDIKYSAWAFAIIYEE
ncbi:MAG: hypothetical protein WBD09_07340 [Halobacteriota archaeon]